MDSRLQQLTDWVRQFSGLEQATPVPVSGDASFRRYFRVQNSPSGRVQNSPGGSAHNSADSYIVMDAPPEHEDCRPFVAIAEHWQRHGIAVPRVEAQDLEQGFLLLEDFGDTQLLSELNDASADAFYDTALRELCRIQQLPPDPARPLPTYDTALLNREMHLFPDWLLSQELGLPLGNSEHALLDTVFAFLRESALAQPLVPVHRDYHSRNLLVRPGTTVPGVIDFQDAVQGPVTYDLVSLLKDCYIRWPEEKICQWVEQYRVMSLEAGLHQADPDTFRQWFELMGMQRHLKAAGIFARLAIRDGKTGFLGDVPRTVQYLIDASGRQAALRHFHDWLQEVVMPAIKDRLVPQLQNSRQPQENPGQ